MKSRPQLQISGHPHRRRSLFARLTLPLPIIWLAFSLPADTAGPAVSRPEYEVKAVAVQKFAGFLEWPARCFAKPDAPLIVGVLGKDPFEGRLEATLAKKEVNHHPLTVRHFTRLEEVVDQSCHVLFISSSEQGRLAEILDKVKALPILTVGDTAQYGEKGVMINLIRGPTLKFEIEAGRAKAAGLKISSQLLGLAETVRGRGKPEE